MTVNRTVILTAGTTWQVPNTWNNLDNYVICIGGGGGSTYEGGGGAAYARSDNITLTPNSTISILIGAGGLGNVHGGYTSFASNTVQAQGGRANGQARTITSGSYVGGGIGGSDTSSVGQIKYSGGTGGNGVVNFTGGGGGGAGGNTAVGQNGGHGTASQLAGNGGNSGATSGGKRGLAISGAAGQSGYAGYPWATDDVNYGQNFAGGGGAGGSYVTSDAGTTYYGGGGGGAFGGGAGGAGDGSGSFTYAGNGAIILSWNYESRLPDTPAQYSMSNVSIALNRNPYETNTSLNRADIRSLFRKPTDATQISFSDGAGKVANATVVGATSTSGTSSTISLPASWLPNDLAILFIQNATASGSSPTNAPTVSTPGWEFLGNNSRAVNAGLAHTTAAFSRILQSGDAAPTFTQSNGGALMLVLRNASYVSAIQKVDANTSTIVRFTGFTKNTDSKMLVSFVSDRDLANPTPPTGWTTEIGTLLSFFYVECATVNSVSYVNGTNIEWTGYGSGGLGQVGILLEVT